MRSITAIRARIQEELSMIMCVATLAIVFVALIGYTVVQAAEIWGIQSGNFNDRLISYDLIVFNLRRPGDIIFGN